MKICAEPGCPELCNAIYCDAHYRARRRASDRQRPSASERGYDAKWRQTRRGYLRHYPLCQDATGCISPATDVHHLDGLGPSGEHGHDPDNLQALCHRHHSIITSQEQKGGWNA